MRSTEEAVHESAVELMAARGYHGTSLRMVARDVGVQMSSLYYYFPSKQALLLAIMEKTMADLADSVRTAIEAADGAPAKLAAAIRAHVVFHAQRRRETLITDSELRALEPEHRERIVALRDAYAGQFLTIIEQGSRDGSLNVDDVPIAVNALMTMCAGVAVWYRPGGPLSIEQIADMYVQSFMRGVLTGKARAKA